MNLLYFFPTEYHQDILNDDLGIVPMLLFPIVSGKDLTDEENDAFPVELQYLDEDKKIEKDTELKIALLESIHVVSLYHYFIPNF